MGVGALPRGTRLGSETSTLTESHLPQHSHTIGVSDQRATTGTPGSGAVHGGGTRTFGASAGGAMHQSAVSAAGGSPPHPNMQPYLTLNAIIAVEGIFSSAT